MKIGIITVSDTCSLIEGLDKSGPALIELTKNKYSVEFTEYLIVPDDQQKIESALQYFSDVLNLNIVFTTGGTGFAARDVTPEATKNVILKEAPQLSLAMALSSLEKTKFAVLSRAICGIRNNTLIINFPGSKKAVEECFASICDVLPHAAQLIANDLNQVKKTHTEVQKTAEIIEFKGCCHSSVNNAADSRESKFRSYSFDDALKKMFQALKQRKLEDAVYSPINVPSFRASIKDGYAMKSSSGKGIKKVLACVSAGDNINIIELNDNECFKINTGAALPAGTDSIVQIEDTKLISFNVDGTENEVEILVEPRINVDIRPVGSDMKKDELLFDTKGPYGIPQKSVLASVGLLPPKQLNQKIAILITGDELIQPGNPLKEGRIYDSNTTMIRLLLNSYGYDVTLCEVVKDSYEAMKEAIRKTSESCDFIISSGGVSMGDKDYVKPALQELSYNIVFGRVEIKPGKPMTFAVSKDKNKYFFGLPGNPVSAFVTFHLFVLAALKYVNNFTNCSLPIINVTLQNDKYELDARPEFVRATIISKAGNLYAEITGNQISSRLKSIINADVLLQLPARSQSLSCIEKGATVKAYILKHDFISKYLD